MEVHLSHLEKEDIVDHNGVVGKNTNQMDFPLSAHIPTMTQSHENFNGYQNEGGSTFPTASGTR